MLALKFIHASKSLDCGNWQILNLLVGDIINAVTISILKPHIGDSTVCLGVCLDLQKRKHQSPRYRTFVREYTGDQWIPSQMASNTETLSIWWRCRWWIGNSNDLICVCARRRWWHGILWRIIQIETVTLRIVRPEMISKVGKLLTLCCCFVKS